MCERENRPGRSKTTASTTAAAAQGGYDQNADAAKLKAQQWDGQVGGATRSLIGALAVDGACFFVYMPEIAIDKFVVLQLFSALDIGKCSSLTLQLEVSRCFTGHLRGRL